MMAQHLCDMQSFPGQSGLNKVGKNKGYVMDPTFTTFSHIFIQS